MYNQFWHMFFFGQEVASSIIIFIAIILEYYNS